MDAWPMIARCWLTQWLGFTPEEQAYMIQESERGYPMGITLGHDQHDLWSVERYTVWSPYPLTTRNADHLISIKVDHWPEDMPKVKSGSSPAVP